MNWLALTLVSAFLLGLYDLFKKQSVNGNAVVPVLFLSTVFMGLTWGILLAFQAAAPASMPAILRVDPVSWTDHLMLFSKSAIVGASWIFAYFGMKHLPVSLASPIRATGPLWTFIGALLILGERPTWVQILGIATTLLSFLALSAAGRREGVHFLRDRHVWYMVVGTLFGGASALYDKFLLGSRHFPVSTVQAWFSIYLVVIFLPLALGWKLRWWPRNQFHWRWSIPMIAVALLLADFAYFYALTHPEALVSLVSSLRRGSTLVAFVGGIVIYRELNVRHKLPAVLGVLLGITLTALG